MIREEERERENERVCESVYSVQYSDRNLKSDICVKWMERWFGGAVRR